MRKVKEVTIGEHRYQLEQLGAISSGELIFRVGAAMFALVGASSLTPATVMRAMSGLKVEDFNWVIGEFIRCTKVSFPDKAAKPLPGGQQRTSPWVPLADHYDEHFADNMVDDWPEWLKEVAEVNFGRFFAARAAKAQGPAATGTSPSTSQPTPAGQPTDSSAAPG
jgi:hypothetical protein